MVRWPARLSDMSTRWLHRVRALLALAMFATSDGGEQLLDALLFHGRPAASQDIPRVNDVDHCHAEKCELGAPIASPPPASPPDLAGRFETISFRVAVVAPSDPPRSAIANAPLGSRAPPHRP